MSTDLAELSEFLKKHIDEIFLLEEKADMRAEALSKASKDCVNVSQEQISHFVSEMKRVLSSDVLQEIQQSSKEIGEYLSFCKNHMKFASKVCLGSIVLSACIWIATYCWYQHVSSQVAEARIELTQTNAKLKNKPLFLASSNSVSGSQSDYVRVVPNTETTMSHTNGKPYPGVYAEVWTKDNSK